MSNSIAKRGRGRPRKASIKSDVCPYTTSRKSKIKIKVLEQQDDYWDHVISVTPRKPRTKNTRILSRKKQSWGQRYLLDHNLKPNSISQKEVEGVPFLDLDASPINTRSPLLSNSIDRVKPISSQNEVEAVFITSSSSSSELKISLSTPLSEYIIPGPIPDYIYDFAWDEDINCNFWEDIPDFEE
nr:hypothetical protein Iba_chr11aCG19400 [Ipomoea batatas]